MSMVPDGARAPCARFLHRMEEDEMVSWEKPPRAHDAYVQTRDDVAKELTANPKEWAVVARHDRAARAETHVGRIESGREYGEGFEAVYRQVGNEHRVYARKVR